MINKKPIIQICANKPPRVNETDISEVAGAFISFSSPNDEIILKLITKKKTTEIKISNEKDFESFKDQIEIILDDFHAGKESIFSMNKNRRAKLSSKMSSGFESMHITNSSDLEEAEITGYFDIGDIAMKDSHENTGYFDISDIAMKDSHENIFGNIFNENYPVTQFNSKVKPLKGGLEKLEKFSVPIKHNEINFNHFICLKIREEISHEGGVKIEIDEKDIDNFSTKFIKKELWISNISNPKIAENLHIGDRIMLVNGKVVTDKFAYQQQVKHKNNTLIIQRLPKAKVFSINPTDFNKNITFKHKNYRYQMSLNGKKENWWITEVNNQNTINMSSNSINFKNENTTLVIQPFEFIKSLINLTP